MRPRFGVRDVQLFTGWSRRDARRLVRLMRRLELHDQAWNIASIKRCGLSPRLVFAAWDVARSGEAQTALVDVRTR